MTDLGKLKSELETFRKNKNKLLIKAKGKFVLIKKEEIVGTFSNYEDALAEGYKLFGNEPFLVKEVAKTEEVNFFTRPSICV